MSFCPKCGRKIYEEEKGCPVCGIINQKEYWDSNNQKDMKYIEYIKEENVSFQRNETYHHDDTKEQFSDYQEKEEKRVSIFIKIFAFVSIIIFGAGAVFLGIISGLILQSSGYEDYRKFGHQLVVLCIIMIIIFIIFHFSMLGLLFYWINGLSRIW